MWESDKKNCCFLSYCISSDEICGTRDTRLLDKTNSIKYFDNCVFEVDLRSGPSIIMVDIGARSYPSVRSKKQCWIWQTNNAEKYMLIDVVFGCWKTLSTLLHQPSKSAKQFTQLSIIQTIYRFQASNTSVKYFVIDGTFKITYFSHLSNGVDILEL